MITLSKPPTIFQHLVIIGSGPVGMTAALLLQDQFQQVTVLERQSRENFLRKGGFTFPIVFTPASIKILQKIGAWEAIEAERSEFFGVVLHKRLLGKDFQFKSVEEGVFSHWRNHIVSSLYQRVVEAGIKVHFNARIEEINFTANLCRESSLGELPFDLLIGADGIKSQTRELLSQAHPDYKAEDFKLILLDRWYAYRLPAEGRLKEKFNGGEGFLASNVFVDNLQEFPREKFRVVTTSMKQPEEEISVLVKYSPDLTLERVKALNEVFLGNYHVDPKKIRQAWGEGVGGTFDQVDAPTFYLKNVLLLGDAAHGFESTGDLINLGLTSVESFSKILSESDSIPGALSAYDERIGENLRYYAKFSLRRSMEKIGFEVASIEFAARLGLARRHPGLFGIYVDDFEIESYMESYRRDKRVSALLVLGLAIAGVILAGWILF